MLPQILFYHKLFEYSNQYIDVRIDLNLPLPAFSIIEKNIYGRFVPVILINEKIMQENENVIAHIMSHEWGHHVSNHIELIPPSPSEMPTKEERQEKENEADLYAAKFIKEYMYDRGPIIDFLKKHPADLENRLKILNSQFE